MCSPQFIRTTATLIQKNNIFDFKSIRESFKLFNNSKNVSMKISTNFTSIVLVLVCFINTNLAIGQPTWAGSLGTGTASSVIVDNAGNVIISGYVDQGQGLDFDIGPSIFASTGSIFGYGRYIAKYSPSGNILWAKSILTYAGYTQYATNKIAVDQNDNIFFAGSFYGSCNFDPDPDGGAVVTTLNNTPHAYVVKFDPQGNFQWVKTAGGSFYTYPGALDVDSNGDVVIAGTFSDTVDFDPSDGVYNLSESSGGCFIWKLSNSGSFIFAKNFGVSNANDLTPSVLKLSSSNQIIIGGSISSNVVDFDPSAATTNFSGGYGCFIAKYNADGSYLAASIIPLNGPGYLTISSLTLDSSNNILFTGEFDGAVDFDPVNNNQNIFGFEDTYVCKWYLGTNLSWVRKTGSNQIENSGSIVCSANNDVYVSGLFIGPTDFDPNPATYTVGAFPSGTNPEPFYWKLNSAGEFVWVKTFDGKAWSAHMALSPDGKTIYTTGNYATVDLDIDPGLGVNYLPYSGGFDVFFLSMCTHILANPVSNAPVCIGEDVTLTSNSVPGATYNWSGPNMFSSTSQNTSILNSSTLNEGLYTLQVNDGCTSSETLNIDLFDLPSISTNSQSEYCEGINVSITASSSPSGNIYNWSGPNALNQSGSSQNLEISNFSSLNLGLYTLSVVDVNGCVSADNFTISNVLNTPDISCSVSDNTICFGEAITVNATTDAQNLTWSDGLINGETFYPTMPGFYNYTAYGTNSNGCEDSCALSFVVNLLPEVNYSIVNPNEQCSGICNGSAVLFNPFEPANYSYLWDDNANNQITAMATELCPGIYYVNVTTPEGCSITETVEMTQETSSITDPEVFLTNLAAVDQVNVSPSFASYYAYNLPPTINPNPTNPRNFVDPGKKARFKIECTNQKFNGQSIVSGICKVRTNSIYVNVTDSSSALNNIGWSGNAWSADEFEIDISPSTPAGTNIYIDFVVQEGWTEYSTRCISIPITPLVYSPTSPSTIDDDNNPDSQGNDNDLCEPGETIEFYPWLDNISTLNAEYVRGKFENLDNYSFVNIWNGLPGVGTTVYDATWWNYSFAEPQVINASSQNTTPEYDFVFDYNIGGIINDFNLYMVMAGGFKLFPGEALSLVQWTLPYTFNYSGDPLSVSENSQDLDQFILYPNPTTNSLSIKTYLDNSKITYCVLNSIGQVVLNGQLNSEISTIDLKSIDSGFYTILFNDGVNKSYKFIKL